MAFGEEVLHMLRLVADRAPDRRSQGRFVGQYPCVCRSINVDRSCQRVRRADYLMDTLSPTLAKTLGGKEELDAVLLPVDAQFLSLLQKVFDERRIPSKNDLIEFGRYSLKEGKGNVFIQTGSNSRHRVTFQGKVFHAGTGKHAADPGTHRETINIECAISIHLEDRGEYAFELKRAFGFLGFAPRPHKRLTGRT